MNQGIFLKKCKTLSLLLKINNTVNQSMETLFILALTPVVMTFEILKCLLLFLFWLPSLCCGLLWLIWWPTSILKDRLIEIFARQYFGMKNPSVTKIKQFRKIKNQIMMNNNSSELRK